MAGADSDILNVMVNTKVFTSEGNEEIKNVPIHVVTWVKFS